MIEVNCSLQQLSYGLDVNVSYPFDTFLQVYKMPIYSIEHSNIILAREILYDFQARKAGQDPERSLFSGGLLIKY